MIFRTLKTGLLGAALAVLFGCSEPPVPPEVQLALSQEQDLWRAGASVYAATEYQQYLDSLTSGRTLLSSEQARLLWFRDYAPISGAFREVLSRGEQLNARIAAVRAAESAAIAGGLKALQKKITVLRDLSSTLKDRRLAMRKLIQAEIKLQEARQLAAGGRGGEARQRVDEAEHDVAAVVKVVKPLVSRYLDQGEIRHWRRLATEAVEESRSSGGPLILVSKVDRQLTLYRRGVPQRSFDAGMGFNFLADKLYSGDRATPEGRYRVVRKIERSTYFRALLIDYPNEADRKRFARAKQAGQIPRNAAIGNSIEIHGGSTDGMTNGCVALEDREMADLFDLVEVGTPVVIVGTVDHDNFIVSALRGLN